MAEVLVVGDAVGQASGIWTEMPFRQAGEKGRKAAHLGTGKGQCLGTASTKPPSALPFRSVCCGLTWRGEIGLSLGVPQRELLP